LYWVSWGTASMSEDSWIAQMRLGFQNALFGGKQKIKPRQLDGWSVPKKRLRGDRVEQLLTRNKERTEGRARGGRVVETRSPNAVMSSVAKRRGKKRRASRAQVPGSEPGKGQRTRKAKTGGGDRQKKTAKKKNKNSAVRCGARHAN